MPDTSDRTDTSEAAFAAVPEAIDAAVPEAIDAAVPEDIDAVRPADRASGPTVAVADAVFHQLDPRSIRVQRIIGWLTAAIIAGALLVALLVVLLSANLPVWAPVPLVALWLALVAPFVWLAHRWPAIAYRHTSYRVDGLGIEVRRGVVWRTIVSVPRSRVQHTDVSQGPLERSHGLGTLVVYTAGTNHARVGLGGLAYERALALRDHLVAGEGADAV